jgi:hypothetical protein
MIYLDSQMAGRMQKEMHKKVSTKSEVFPLYCTFWCIFPLCRGIENQHEILLLLEPVLI